MPVLLLADLKVLLLWSTNVIKPSKKFIYLKTKKTAGTSTEVFLQRWCVPEDISAMSADELHYGDERVSDAGIVGARGSAAQNFTFYNHMPAGRIIEQVGIDVWREYFKFVNVRNPFTRAVSQFFWRRPWLANRSETLALKRSHSGIEVLPSIPELQHSFTNMLKEIKRPSVEKFLLNGHKLDFYIKYESLHDDLAEVMRRLNLDSADLAKLPTLKAGSWTNQFPDHRVLFTEESEQIVRSRYQDWIDEFGYKF